MGLASKLWRQGQRRRNEEERVKLTSSRFVHILFSSNGGVFGSLFGTPIINLPQAAVLGGSAALPLSLPFLIASADLPTPLLPRFFLSSAFAYASSTLISYFPSPHPLSLRFTTRAGMHNITDRAVVVKGQIVVRPIMTVALTYDHRLLDGREAVQFLGESKALSTIPCFVVKKDSGDLTSQTSSSNLFLAPCSQDQAVHRGPEEDVALSGEQRGRCDGEGRILAAACIMVSFFTPQAKRDKEGTNGRELDPID